jgi:hypothetical protein
VHTDLILIETQKLEPREPRKRVLLDVSYLIIGQVEDLQGLQAAKEGRPQGRQLIAGQAEAVQVGQPGSTSGEVPYSILAEVEGAQRGCGGHLGWETGEEVGAEVEVLKFRGGDMVAYLKSVAWVSLCLTVKST